MITYRELSFQLLSSSYAKDIELKRLKKKPQPPQRWQLIVVSLFLFYFTLFSYPFHMGWERRKPTVSREHFAETSEENQRLSGNLTSSNYRKLRVWLKVWCTLTKNSKTPKGFSGSTSIYGSLRKQLWLKYDSSMNPVGMIQTECEQCTLWMQ